MLTTVNEITVLRPPVPKITIRKHFKTSSNQVNDSHNNNKSVCLNSVNNTLIVLLEFCRKINLKSQTFIKKFDI